MWSLSLLSSLLLLSRSAVAGTTQEWKSRSIYQVMTDRFARTDGATDAPCDPIAAPYCGGTWRGIIDKLDYIQGMGFDAIYISPVTQNLEGNTTYGYSYHGYWPQDIYSINEHFGSIDDLKALSQSLHDRKMFLMVDVVINDMAYNTNGKDPGSNVDYSVFNPFNDKRYFHSYCEIKDYDNYTDAQICWFGDDKVALPDLNTEDPEVSGMMNDWVVKLVQDYSIDGLRVDAVKHVGDAFLKSFAEAAGVFTIGEEYEGDPFKFCHYQTLMPSMTNYPNYFPMIKAFTKGNISALSLANPVTKRTCGDTTALASFSENHDLPRIASYTKDPTIIKTVLAWTMLADGIPMIYQGQEAGLSGAGVPANREAIWLTQYDTNNEFYQFITLMNSIRRHAITVNADYLDYQSHVIYSDDSTIAFRKGEEGRHIVSVLSSGGDQTQPYTLDLPTAYTTGTQVTDVVACMNYTINEYGQLELPMGGGMPFVFFPADHMNGSGLCGFGNVSLQDLRPVPSAAASERSGESMALFAAAGTFVAVVASLAALV